MEVVKRNLASIICGVVALACVVFIFYPMGGYFGQLQDYLNSSLGAYQELRRINGETFKKPNIDPSKPEGEPLDQFPNRPTIDAGKKVVDLLAAQTRQMMDQVRLRNKREPLIAGSLPNGRGHQLSAFKQSYYAKLLEFRAQMRATTPPDANEVALASQKLWEDDFKGRIQVVGDQEVNRQQVEQQFRDRVARLPEEMRVQRAESFVMYVSSDKAIHIHPGMPPATDFQLPSIEDVWAAQLGLWIQQDVVDAIIRTNAAANASRVSNAVVKRLVRIDIPKDYITAKGKITVGTTAAGGMAGGSMAMAPPMMVDPNAVDAGVPTPPDQPDYTLTATGRVCNTLYDVIHFTVVVDANGRRYTEFIRNLSEGRFITVHRVHVIGVDRNKEYQRGYVYGPDPVARVAVECEAIFFRDWTLPLMPTIVQQRLGIIPATGPLGPGGPMVPPGVPRPGYNPPAQS